MIERVAVVEGHVFHSSRMDPLLRILVEISAFWFAPPIPLPDVIGSTLGHYEVEALLGAGGMDI